MATRLDDRETVLLVLKGVVEGLALESQISLDTIKDCITDSELVFNDIKYAVELLQSNELEKVKEGIKKIGEAIQVLPDAITACHSTQQELVDVAKEITALLNQMRHPLTFGFIVGKNLVLNGREIFSETYTAVQDYRNQQYEDFGV